MEFCSARVRKKYTDKTDDELKPIFIAAVTSWDDLREEYPDWKARQEKKAQIALSAAATAVARCNRPVKCEYCGGGDLSHSYDDQYFCKGCNSGCSFDSEKNKWVWRK